jgi:hypothetical protein
MKAGATIMRKIVHVSKNGNGVVCEGPYDQWEEEEFYARQRPKAIHRKFQDQAPHSPPTLPPQQGEQPQEE